MKQSIRNFSIVLGSFLFINYLCAEDPPNVILLMGDDHGWDETAYNGHSHLITPILDSMAESGLRMDRFYSAHPSCSPTRGSVLTGRHPNRYGTFSPNWSIRPEEIGIGTMVKKAGYYTGHFGKWHVGPVKAKSPTNPGVFGFDEWLSHDNFFELDPVLVRNGGPPIKYSGESSEILIDETIRFINDAKENKKPFLAVVWFGSPHEPYMGLPEDLALYENLPKEWADIEVRLTSLETGQATRRPFLDVMQERYAEITAMDRAIGKLRTHLALTGLWENTIVWYCGDNGIPTSGNITNPYRGQKGTVYGGGIRVPGVIEWPKGIPNPQVTNTITVTSDILPTLCELVGVPLPDRPIDGISLKGLFEGTMTNRPEPVFFWQYDTRAETAVERENYIDPQLQEGTTPLVKIMDGKYTRTFRNFKHPEIRQSDYNGPRTVLSNRYKLVIDGESKSFKELFDIRKDPLETTNLIEDLPELAVILENQMNDWQHSVVNSLTGADY